eukprot:g8283.t1
MAAVALGAGDAVGGATRGVVQGHVDCAIRVLAKQQDRDNLWVTFELPGKLRPLVVEKGYVAIGGASLTVCNVTRSSFQVMLIPHTVANITLPQRNAGERVNCEAHVIGKYINAQLRLLLGEEQWRTGLIACAAGVVSGVAAAGLMVYALGQSCHARGRGFLHLFRGIRTDLLMDLGLIQEGQQSIVVMVRGLRLMLSVRRARDRSRGIGTQSATGLLYTKKSKKALLARVPHRAPRVTFFTNCTARRKASLAGSSNSFAGFGRMHGRGPATSSAHCRPLPTGSCTWESREEKNSESQHEVRNLCNLLYFCAEWRLREEGLLRKIFASLRQHSSPAVLESDWLACLQTIRCAAVLDYRDADLERRAFREACKRREDIETRQAATLVWSFCVLGTSAKLAAKAEGGNCDTPSSCTSAEGLGEDEQKEAIHWLDDTEFRHLAQDILFSKMRAAATQKSSMEDSLQRPQHDRAATITIGNQRGQFSLTDVRMALRAAIALDYAEDAACIRGQLWGLVYNGGGRGGSTTSSTPKERQQVMRERIGQGLQPVQANSNKTFEHNTPFTAFEPSASEKQLAREMEQQGFRFRREVWLPQLDRSVDFVLDVVDHPCRGGARGGSAGSGTTKTNEAAQLIVLEYDGPNHFFRTPGFLRKPTGRDQFEAWLLKKLNYDHVRMPYLDTDPFRGERTWENRQRLWKTYGLVNLPPAIAHNAGDCDAHARLALGLVDEDNKGKESKFFKWIQLLPKNFANVLWYQEDQRTLVRQTYFKYILLDWEDQVACMERAYIKEYGMLKGVQQKKKVRYQLYWAFSIVKTRGFAFDTSRNSTLLIPLADFLNHHPKSNVRTPDPLGEEGQQQGAEASAVVDEGTTPSTSSGSGAVTTGDETNNYISFKASSDVDSGEEMCIEYSQASNLEFMIRYGFKKCVDEFYSRRIRSDLVQPVNTDTVEIATRIAGEILSKMPSSGPGPGVPRIDFHSARELEKRHLGPDAWGVALTPAASARAESIARGASDQVSSLGSAGRKQLGDARAINRRRAEPLENEYVRVHAAAPSGSTSTSTSSSSTSSTCAPTCSGARLWHSSNRGKAVSRGTRVITLEGALFDGMPVLLYNTAEEQFEKRFLKLDSSYNFFHFTTSAAAVVQGGADGRGGGGSGAGGAKTRAGAGAGESNGTVALRVDSVGTVMFGEKAYHLVKELLMVHDPRVTIKDLTVLVRKEEKKKVRGGEKVPLSRSDEERRERILRADECTIILSAPQQQLRRFAAAATITSAIRSRLLRRRVKQRYRVLEHLRIVQRPRFTFFTDTEVAYLEVDFRLLDPVPISLEMKGHEFVDAEMNQIGTKDAIQAALTEKELLSCVASLQEMVLEMDDVRNCRSLVHRTEGALWVVAELVLATDIRTFLDEEEGNDPDPASYGFTDNHIALAYDYVAKKEAASVHKLDFEDHDRLLDLLETADLYYISRCPRKLKRLESAEARAVTVQYLREEDNAPSSAPDESIGSDLH